MPGSDEIREFDSLAQLHAALRQRSCPPFEPNRIKPAPHRPPPAVYENGGYVIEGEFKVID